MTIEETIRAANRIDWYLVTLCQYGRKDNLVYRATFQHRLPNGATEDAFREYEDAPDAATAVSMAFKRCQLSSAALEAAFDANRKAREKTGASRRVLRKGRL